MKNCIIALTTILMAVLLVPSALGEASTRYCVVVQHDNPLRQLSRTELARIFLGRKTLWPTGERVEPILLSLNEPAVEEFIRIVLRRSPAQYHSYWKRRLFSGGGTPPRIFARQEDMLTHLEKRSNAIAIVVREPETCKNSIEITD